MAIFSNHYFFAFLQIAVFALIVYTLYRDFKLKWPRGGVTMTVTRAEESMRALDKVTGAVIAAIIVIINKSVFDEDKTWNHYSAFFNVADILAVLYFGYFSPWGRNLIIGWSIRSKKD